MKTIISLSVAVGGALFLLACGCSKPVTPANVLAKVGHRDITVEDFENEVRWYAEHRRSLPARDALLEEMISRELRVQKARTLGLDADPDVRRAFDLSLAAKLEERELQPSLAAAQVSPEEVAAAYQKDISHYTSRAKIRLALVWIKTDLKASPETVAQLEVRMAEARKLAQALPPGTRGFGSVAAEYSDDQASRYRGGDVGWFDAGSPTYRWPAEVVNAGFALPRNHDLSEVIKAADGFYIVSRLDSREPVVTPQEQVRNSIQHRLASEKRDQVSQAFAQRIHGFATVQTFPQALQNVQYPTSALASAREPQQPALSFSP